MGYKPDGHTSVSPYVIVDDAQGALDFIEAVFDVEPLLIHRQDDGTIMHAEARIDDSVVMVGQMTDAPDAHVHVYVPDVDATFARAIEAGGSAIQKVETKPDGDRRGGVRDPQGTTWWLATRQL